MFFLLLSRIAKRHLGFHLAIPLVVVALLSIVFDWAIPAMRGAGLHFPRFSTHWFLQRTSELVGIYISFLFVIAFSVKKAGDIRTARVDKLRDILPGSTRYFAIGTTPLREWFEPNSQIYLATIIQYQFQRQAMPIPTGAPAHFRHERVLLFYTATDWKALQASYLDEPYAKSFAAIHKRFGIPLAYLGPEEMQAILLGLNENDRRALVCERRLVVWLKRRLPKIPLAWTIRRTPGMLPYALIEGDGGTRILRFSKQGNTLTLYEVEKTEEVEAHKNFVKSIEAKIYNTNHVLKEEFKFANYLFPGGCE
jgi:hypothetical protein